MTKTCVPALVISFAAMGAGLSAQETQTTTKTKVEVKGG
jgi:hypothetical protein